MLTKKSIAPFSLVCFGVGLIFFHFLAIAQTPSKMAFYCLQFDKEKIRIEISETEYTLTGDYYFRNPTALLCQQQLFYPVVVDSNLPFPHFFEVTDLLEKQSVGFTKTERGILFPIEVPAYGEKVFQVKYKQQAFKPRLEYILTTTSHWNKPLRSADFLISLPEDFELVKCSYHYNKVPDKGNSLFYLIHQDNFDPDKNLVIEWRRYEKK